MGRKTVQEDRPIRIIQIDNIRWFNVGAGYAVALSRGLREMGHEVLFMGKGRLPPVQEAMKAGIDVNNSLSFKPQSLLQDALRLRGLILEFRPDVINAHRSEGMNLALMARFISGRKDMPVIRTRMDIRALRPTAFNRWLYRRVDGAVAPWREGLDRHLQLGISPERVITLPGGVDIDRFCPDVDGSAFREQYDIPPDAPLAGIVGRLDPVKGHDDFLRAASHTLDRVPRAYFAVIGAEANVTVQELKSLAQELGVSDRVRFVGWREDIERCVAALDVGVVASTGSEALSRTALEYMAAGKPVVATRTGCLPELIEPGETGMLIHTRKPEELGTAIARLLADPEERTRMGVEARRRAQRDYSIGAIARRTVDFYEQIKALRAKN